MMIWRQIQWRLTLWNTLLMAVVVTVFATSVYLTMTSTAHSQLSAAMEDAARVAASEWQARHELRPASYTHVVAMRVADRSGRTLSSEGNLPGGEAPPPSERTYRTLHPPDEGTVAVRTIETGGLLVTVAMDQTQTEDRLEDLRRTLAMATLAAALFSGIVGLFMARLALRPIDRMSAAARRIAFDPGSGRLARIPLQPPEDDLYRLGETFNAMLDRIEQAFAQQNRFLADASHELRTPLTVIQSYANLLTRWGKGDPAILKESLGAIKQEAGRMSRLVDDLLLLARGDANLRLEREPVELGALLRALGRDLTVAAESLGGRRTEAPGPVAVQVIAPKPAWVEGDAQYLRQLVLALAENAIQYTPTGGEVTLSLDQRDETVLIHVADTGIGIPPEEQAHIFDRFHRVDRDRARATGGSGLGLSIATWLARVHGGSIAGRSQPGVGSTFTVTLPRLSLTDATRRL